MILYKSIQRGGKNEGTTDRSKGKSYPLYILLDSQYKMVIPVMEFIKYLDNTGKAPNTIKTYCYHLKLFYEFIERKISSLIKYDLKD